MTAPGLDGDAAAELAALADGDVGVQAAVFPHCDAVADLAGIAYVRAVAYFAVRANAGIGSHPDPIRIDFRRRVDDGRGMNTGHELIGGSLEVFDQGIEGHGRVGYFYEGDVFRIFGQSRRHQDNSRGSVQEVFKVFLVAQEGGFLRGGIEKRSDPEHVQFGVARRGLFPR